MSKKATFTCFLTEVEALFKDTVFYDGVSCRDHVVAIDLKTSCEGQLKKCISLKMYEEKQILNIATNRNQRGLKMFYIECHKFRCPSN